MLLGGPWFEVDLVGLYWFAKWCRWSKVVMDGPLSIMVQCELRWSKRCRVVQDGPWSMDFSMVPSGFKLVYPKTNMVSGGARYWTVWNGLRWFTMALERG